MAWLKFGKYRARKELFKLLRGQEVQSFPVVASKVLELLREPEVDFQKVAEQLKYDPALTVQVLRTVNSSAYGASRPIQDMQHAVSFLGLAALEQVVLGMAVRNVLPSPNQAGFDLRGFWQTGAYRAAMAKNLSTILHPAKEAECFTAALLQDLAIPVLVNAIPKVYGEALSKWQPGSPTAFEDIEKEILGLGHHEIGGLLCSHWELPEALTSSIALHHSAEATDQTLPAALRLVSILWGEQSEEVTDEFLSLGESEYGLNADLLLELIDKSARQANDLVETLLK